jgi:hypothetical protein
MEAVDVNKVEVMYEEVQAADDVQFLELEQAVQMDVLLRWSVSVMNSIDDSICNKNRGRMCVSACVCLNETYIWWWKKWWFKTTNSNV